MTESNINCFLTLAETLSFTKTSQILYFTQQGVSKNISQLESQLGFPLFRRRGKKIELTDEGQRCYELIGDFKKTFDREISDMRKNYHRFSATLKVGYQNYLELTIKLNEANAQFCEANCGSSISSFRYSPGELISFVLDGTLDAAVMLEQYVPNDSNIIVGKMFSVPTIIMWSKSSGLFSENTKYEDVINAPFIADMFESENMTTFLNRVRNDVNRNNLTPSKVISMPNRDSAYTAAMLGEGVILGSEISHLPNSDSLRRLRTGADETVSCIWHKSNINQSLINSYAEILRDVYSDFRFE